MSQTTKRKNNHARKKGHEGAVSSLTAPTPAGRKHTPGAPSRKNKTASPAQRFMRRHAAVARAAEGCYEPLRLPARGSLPEAWPKNVLSVAPAPACSDANEPQFSAAEKMYLSEASPTTRHRIVAAFQNIAPSLQQPIRFRVVDSKLPNKQQVLQRLQGCDSGKTASWVENALALPLGQMSPPPITQLQQMPAFVAEMRGVMDQQLFGQPDAKDEVVRLLCQWISSGCLSTFAIGLEGPPGIGKTTFAQKVIAKTMNRPFQFIGLGGASDACNLLGHYFTYEGAVPGKIAESLQSARVMNPVLFFDELDKLSKTPKGDEISNLLVHLTDREQNMHISDRYFHGVPLDMSNALLIFSYNDPREIPSVLLDRLNVVKFKAPSTAEKICIAQKHLLHRALDSMGLTSREVSISAAVVAHVVEKHTHELGVRGLDKALHRILGTLTVLMNAPDGLRSITVPAVDLAARPIVCTCEMVDNILGDHGPPPVERATQMSMYS